MPRALRQRSFFFQSRLAGFTSYVPLKDQAAGKLVEEKNGPGGEKGHFENFFAAIRDNTPLNSEIQEGHWSTLLCHLGNIAYRTRQDLQTDAQSGHILKNSDAMKLWKREYRKGWEPKV